MSVHRSAADGERALVDLLPVVRRVVAAQVRDPHMVEDLVQETLARVLAARPRIESDTLTPYAIVTARNLIAAAGKSSERDRRRAHLLLDLTPGRAPDEGLLLKEERDDLDSALDRLSPDERAILIAHEVDRRATSELADDQGTTAGAVAARLARTRAKLRVEYLLAHERVEPPTSRCRPVLYAMSAGDRRRQRELDAAGHLLSCESCADITVALFNTRPPAADPDHAEVPVAVDADVVTARQRGREIAARAGFSGTQSTLIATAISEIARNIVKFADRGVIVIRVVDESGRTGVRVVARDRGPGIPDVAAALQDGYSTYSGLGLGLPGARRLMDEFEIVSEPGRGTTVTMTMWR